MFGEISWLILASSSIMPASVRWWFRRAGGSEKPVKSEPPHTLLYLYRVNRRFSPLSFSFSLSIPPPFPRLRCHGFFYACNLSAGLFLFSSPCPTAAYLCPPPPSLSTRLTRIRTTDGACKRWVGAQGGCSDL